MTRTEAEERIMKHIKEIALIMKEYNNESSCLNMSIDLRDNYGELHNALYPGGQDVNMPLDYYTFELLGWDIDD